MRSHKKNPTCQTCGTVQPAPPLIFLYSPPSCSGPSWPRTHQNLLCHCLWTLTIKMNHITHVIFTIIFFSLSLFKKNPKLWEQFPNSLRFLLIYIPTSIYSIYKYKYKNTMTMNLSNLKGIRRLMFLTDTKSVPKQCVQLMEKVVTMINLQILFNLLIPNINQLPVS